MDHQGLGSDAHGWLSSLVSGALPGLPELDHRRVVSELAETIVPLVVAAHQREIGLLRRHLESRWEEERRQEARVLALRNALRFFEETEPDGWRATEALREARWRPPRRAGREDPDGPLPRRPRRPDGPGEGSRDAPGPLPAASVPRLRPVPPPT